MQKLDWISAILIIIGATCFYGNMSSFYFILGYVAFMFGSCGAMFVLWKVGLKGLSLMYVLFIFSATVYFVQGLVKMR